MRYLLLAAALMHIPLIMAQSYPIGTRSVTFFDASRNRNIPSEVHYPGVAAGTDAEVADGDFPMLVMGHGFVMSVNAYHNLRDHFVPLGYIMVLPTTEGGFTPSHGNFGQDLAFLAQAMQEANTAFASPFFGHVSPATALMGHSMGGGASFLGAAGNPDIQALVNFAPAETTPSAIAAASDVFVPTLVFAGQNDCVTPIAEHQAPMYDALAAPCRAFVSIIGGGHCYFGNYNFNCSFGEATCTPSPTITREEQHSVVNDIATLWLDHFLKGDADAFVAVQDSLAESSRVLAESVCLSTGMRTPQQQEWSIGPVPADAFIRVTGPSSRVSLMVIDTQGRVLLEHRDAAGGTSIDVGALPNGSYRLVIRDGDEVTARAFVILR